MELHPKKYEWYNGILAMFSTTIDNKHECLFFSLWYPLELETLI